MPTLIEKPTRVSGGGNKPIEIDEYVGRASSGEALVSVAVLRCPPGWAEPGQRPDFDEYTLVLTGTLRIEHPGGILDVRAGQAVLVRRGERVRYSTPGEEGAEYVAVCLPAFTLEAANRDEA
jgi:mannose-6-phosphate isomerase-like protein (cupin superfamily)